MELGPALKRYRWVARSYWSRRQSYLWAVRLQSERAAIDGETEIVIDGYPRSANTFAAVAFQMAQPQPVRLAHHLHAASQVVAAVRGGVPTIVLVRDPRNALTSQVIRSPHLSLQKAAGGYARFYEALQPLRAEIVVGQFERVTRDFGCVVQEVNSRFGTDFALFSHDALSVNAVNALIDEQSMPGPWERTINRYVSGRISAEMVERLRQAGGRPAGVSEERVSRPSERRAEARERLCAEYDSVGMAAARKRVESAYHLFAEG